MNDVLKRIIIITKSGVLLDVLSVYLEGWFQSNIEVMDTSRKVEECFAEGTPKGVDLLIVEDRKLLAAAQKTIADFMAPTIIIGKAPEQSPVSGRRIAYLPAPINLKELSDMIQIIAQPLDRAPREYCRVRMEILALSGKELTQDVYSLKKDGSYAPALRKGEKLELNEEIFSKLNQGKYLFLKISDFAAFMNGLALDMQRISSAPEKIFDIEAAIKLTTNIHDLLAEALPEFGFTPELQQATKAAIDVVIRSIENDARLADLIKSLSKNDSEYPCWHSVTTCYIACRLSTLMTWHSQSTLHKLSFAGFLHDITLKTTALQRVKSLDEPTLVKASKAEKAEFHEHPHEAAALARAMKDFPGDVDFIIAQHHELPNGKGFPLGVNHARISPLAALFIIAHEIADELFDNRDGFDLKLTVAQLEKKFNSGYFRQIIVALKELSRKEGASL